MRSFKKILCLTFIITASFLARDTFMIKGPLDMSPTITILITSFLSSLILINIFENRKTENHSKIALAVLSFTIGIISMFGAYIFDITNYTSNNFGLDLINNLQTAILTLKNFGFITIILCIVFGLIFGSNRKLGKATTYKSSRHGYKYNY